MASSPSGLCWPSRFLMRLTALFLGSLVVGMLLGAIPRKKELPKPPPPPDDHVQALIAVYGRYQGTRNYARIAANLYYTDDSHATNPDKMIPTLADPLVKKTDKGGSSVAFMVEQVDILDHGNGKRVPLGKPMVYWAGPWIKKDNDIMNIQVDLPYPKPPNLHY